MAPVSQVSQINPQLELLDQNSSSLAHMEPTPALVTLADDDVSMHSQAILAPAAEPPEEPSTPMVVETVSAKSTEPNIFCAQGLAQCKPRFAYTLELSEI